MEVRNGSHTRMEVRSGNRTRMKAPNGIFFAGLSSYNVRKRYKIEKIDPSQVP